MGLGLLLIQTVVNLRQEIKTEAAKLFGVETLCSSPKQHFNETPPAAGDCRELYHRPKCSAFLMFSNTTCENTDREKVNDPSFPPAHQCISGKVPARLQHWMSERVHPLTSTAKCLAFPCAVFSPQDHADSGLPHGPEELPHGCTDVHHAVGKL